MSNSQKTLIQVLPKKFNYFARRSGEKLSHFVEDRIRVLSHDSMSSVIVNDREIRIIGLRRSGNHAIINWIGKQARGNTVFINHVRPLENPYRNNYESQLKLSNKSSQTDTKEDWKYRDIDWWKQEKDGKFSHKDCLIYSYEDQELEKISHASFEKMRNIYLGDSKDKFDVIVMRDPFNLFASRLQTKPRDDGGPNFSMLEVYSRRYSLPGLWISYAKECLDETSFLKNKIVINYNRWFLDAGYRKEIANQLNIDFSDDGLNDISAAGRGSSFDGAQYSGEAHKMDVLNRWKLFSDNDVYRKLLSTDGLLQYSVRLFGEMPGTDILCKN